MSHLLILPCNRPLGPPNRRVTHHKPPRKLLTLFHQWGRIPWGAHFSDSTNAKDEGTSISSHDPSSLTSSGISVKICQSSVRWQR